MNTKLPYPTEFQEGNTLVAWLRMKGYRFTHIPNGTGHSKEAMMRAIAMKRQGTSKGFPDYLIIKNNKLIAIELKRQKGARSSVTPEQREWLGALANCGVEAAFCYGADSAIAFVESVHNAPKDKRKNSQTIF